MYQHQAQADGQSGEVVGGTVGLRCSTEHHQHEHAGEDDFSQQATQHRDVSLQVVGTRSFQSRHISGQQGQQGRADEGTDDLEQHVHATLLGVHASAQEAAKRNGRVDVAPRDAADGVGHGYHCQSEGQSRSDDCGNVVYRVTTQAHGHAAAHQYEHHGADHFSKILFHKLYFF